MKKHFLKRIKYYFFFNLVFIVFAIIILRFQLKFFSIAFPSKAWLHRVNVKEKLISTKDKFEGVELDLVFMESKNNFDIHHPPDLPSKFYLNNYFKISKSNKALKYWLDFKNLREANFLKSAIVLDSIVKIYKIKKNNIIVESTNPEYLQSFNKLGFLTSYYLPSNLNELKEENLFLKIAEIKKNIKENKNINFISSYFRDYILMKENFPDSEILTWILDLDRPIKSISDLKKSIRKFIKRWKVFNDDKVKVVLIRE